MEKFIKKVKGLVQDAAGENQLSDEVLHEIAAGVTADLAGRCKKAGLILSPSVAENPSDIPIAPALPISKSD